MQFMQPTSEQEDDEDHIDAEQVNFICMTGRIVETSNFCIVHKISQITRLRWKRRRAVQLLL